MGGEMEYQKAKAALNSSCDLLCDTSPYVQSQNHVFKDDVMGEDDDLFPVDDLLIDFSNEDEEGSFHLDKEELGSYDEARVFDHPLGIHTFSSQLPLPDDELGELELEWLSQFVDDSLPELPLFLYPIKTSTPVSVDRPPFPAHFPVKARSKRPRIARRDHPSPSDSSSSSGNSSTSCLSFAGGQDEQRLRKRRRRKSNRQVRTGIPQSQRRCTHCQVQRTPQWRAGPLGPKTLCNACGVRYKSGRLLPEYRPACSPTFSMEIHSNSHRKVLEMRRRKDVDGIGGGGGGGLA